MDISPEIVAQVKVITGALVGAFARLFLKPANTIWKSIALILISTLIGTITTPFILWLAEWPPVAGAPIAALIAALGLVILDAAIKLEWGEFIKGWLPKRKP